MIAGVDGYRRGWVAAIDRGDGTTLVEAFRSFADLLAREELSVIVVDVPIGLLPRGPRLCDVQARRLLGRLRASSVFPAPLRAMLKARDWEEACRIRFAIEGQRCPKQVMGILPKIREVDALMTPDLQCRVLEGHPEVSFALRSGRRPIAGRKATKEGRSERLGLLAPHFPDLHRNLSTVPGALPDILDAYACLWSARRILGGDALRLPPDPQMDERGLRAEIVA
ncbi:MAG: DUF429 domain-containing protein [Candidatus Methylomirabilales bacterium]